MEFWKNGILAFKTFEELVDCSILEDPSFHDSRVGVTLVAQKAPLHGTQPNVYFSMTLFLA